MAWNADDPRTGLDRRPIVEVLPLLGFKKDKLGCYKRVWDDRLTVGAGPWFAGWQFTAISTAGQRNDGPRTPGLSEFSHPDLSSPLELLATLYRAFGDAFQAPGTLPPDLEIGRQFTEYQRRTHALTPRPPTVWANREFLRFTLSHIARGRDCSVEDYTIALRFSHRQLRIGIGKQVFFCPAHGTWIDTTVVSARDLFHGLPTRFSRPVVAIQQEGTRLIIDSHMIPASWSEAK